MNYTVIDMTEEWLKDKTPDEIRLGITEDIIILKKNKQDNIPLALFEKINNPQTGAVYCETYKTFFPIFCPTLNFQFEPDLIAIKTELFNSENIVLNSFFQTIAKIYTKAIVRRV